MTRWLQKIHGNEIFELIHFFSMFIEINIGNRIFGVSHDILNNAGKLANPYDEHYKIISTDFFFYVIIKTRIP